MSVPSFRGLSALLFATCTALALAAPPAPQASASGNGVKQLRFDWNAVAGATSYELWFKVGANGTPVRYFQMPATQRSVVNNVSVHLLDWTNARYWVNACDASGCTASNQLAVNSYMLDTIGLLDSPSQQAASQFGYAVAISDDGTTLAAAAPFEASDDPAFPKGSAYIYKRSGNVWAFQSAVPFDVAFEGETRGVTLTLNARGTVLAIGLPGDNYHGTQVGIGFGSAKVYRFVDGTWRQDATIAMRTGFEHGSADQVELDDLGATLAVKTSLGGSGVYIYTYDNAGTWSHTGTAFGHGNDVNDGAGCGRFALSGDGKVLAYDCGSFDPADAVFEVHAAPSWGIRDTFARPTDQSSMRALSLDTTGDTLAVSRGSSFEFTDARVEIHRRVNGTYQRAAVLQPGAWGTNYPRTYPDFFGFDAQFSTDGRLLAVSDPGDRGTGIGALTPPLVQGSKATGAVYVFEQRTNGWALRRVVKPGRPGAAYEAGSFGRDIAFGDNGKTLVVGQPAANNNAGAVWLY